MRKFILFFLLFFCWVASAQQKNIIVKKSSANVEHLTFMGIPINGKEYPANFAQNIPNTAINHIASLLPMRVVLRDSCFKEAKEKMNFFEIFSTKWN